MCWAWLGFLELPIDAGDVRREKIACLHPLISCSIYQEYTVKAMTETHNTLNVQIDKSLNDANSELNILNQKLNSMIRGVVNASSTDPK